MEVAEPWILASLRKIKNVKSILLVGSGKGGVGKSLVSSTIAQLLTEKGKRVGLFDLDIHGPSSHIILGIDNVRLKSSKEGIQPVIHRGIKVMSVAFFIGENPLPAYGQAKSSIVSDLISNVEWGSLDYLVVDLPPGTGDEAILALRVFRRKKHGFVAVATPSPLALNVLKRLVRLLEEEKINLIGVVENMSTLPNGRSHPGENLLFSLLSDLKVDILGKIPYIPEVERYLVEGKNVLEIDELRKSIDRIVENITRKLSAYQ